MKKLFLIFSIILSIGITRVSAETPWSIEFWTDFCEEYSCYGPGTSCHIVITVDAIFPNDPAYPGYIKQYGSSIPSGATVVLIPAAQIEEKQLLYWSFTPLQVLATGSDGKLHTFSLPNQKAPYAGSIDSYIAYANQLN